MITLLLSVLAAPQWAPLFDGKTLNGWTARGGKASYSVEGQDIVGRTVVGTPNSFLCSDKMYGDFELEYEVKVDPRLNSGVQIRSASAPGYKKGQVHGYQIEIDPSARAWSGGFYDEGRLGWLQDVSKNPAGQKSFKNGEWNKFRVLAMGDHFQTWVNGVAVTNFHHDLSRFGFIGLQVHSAKEAGWEVRFRNLRIKDFGVSTMAPPKGGRWLLENERDLKNWTSEKKEGELCPWTWVGKSLQVKPGSGDIVTRDKFKDFQIHVEFAVDENGKTGQQNGNSGVYIQQSYEVQILNSAPRGPLDNECGGIYTVKAPDYAMAKLPGEWQSYDIWFTAAKWKDGMKSADARVTVVHNGVLIHKNVPVPHTTGGGLPEAEGARPVRLQDHGNKIQFRNIWVKG